MRFLVRILIGLIAFVVIALAALYIRTDQLLKVDAWTPTAPLAQGDVLEGARLAKVIGCRGCHTDTLQGQVFVEEPKVYKLVAPNLTQVRAKYDDAAWLRLFRSGAKVDGTVAVGMPLKAFQRLTDREVADLVAYVRSVPAVQTPDIGGTKLWPLARVGMLTGQFKKEDYAADAPESATVLAQRNTRVRGEHIARTACSECHGIDFQGGYPVNAPPLIVAKGYDAAKFARLIRTGKTAAGTESATGLMSEVARDRFAALTDAEVEQLHAYLVAR